MSRSTSGPLTPALAPSEGERENLARGSSRLHTPGQNPPPHVGGYASLVLITLLGILATQVIAQPTPLIHAHAHNDYEHKRPLLDALDHGFCSVEADIWLVDGKLLVAHDRNKVQTARTLESLYLDPLSERAKKNGGRVYRNGPEFTLLIDLKSNWQTTYPALRAVLTKYTDMLTTVRDGKKHTNAVLVVISGSRDRKMFDGEATRYAAFDGELSDLDTNPSPNFAPWISARWGGSFSWSGIGPMPDAEKQKLADIVKRAHEQGRRVRFWGAPDNREFWRTLRAAGVDLINTDDLAGLEKFLKTGGAPPAQEGNNRTTPGAFQISRADYTDRVQAIWTAQIAAALMGFPFEHKVASTIWIDRYPKQYDVAPVDDDFAGKEVELRLYQRVLLADKIPGNAYWKGIELR